MAYPNGSARNDIKRRVMMKSESKTESKGAMISAIIEEIVNELIKRSDEALENAEKQKFQKAS